jgi:hypothetical protein
MSYTGYPVFYSQPGSHVDVFAIDGSAVATSFGSGGLDGRGQAFCSIKDDGANLQTILFNTPYPDQPYVFLTALTANAASTIAFTTSGTYTTGFTLTGFERDDNTATLNDIDWMVQVVSFNTSNFVL